MSAKIISFGIQKGGCSKSTSTAITGFLLSQERRVLAVDFDSQGNLTQLLTQRNIYDFTKRTVLQAIQEKDPRPYIIQVTDTLHVLPAEDLLATFPRWLYNENRGKGNPATMLRETLEKVREDYDYILIDLPPNLGDLTVNGLTASDYAVVMLQSEPFCYDAMDRYLELIDHIKHGADQDVEFAGPNPNIQLAGILTTMLDARASLDTAILERAKKVYDTFVFKSVIKRRSRIKEFAVTGIQNSTKADRDALKNYVDFVKELTARVQ